MSEEIKMSEQDLAKRQDLAQRLQNNILAIGDVEAAMHRLATTKSSLLEDHLRLDQEIREFNAYLNETYTKKEEPVLSVEE
tara:strand:+ start:457 stop:699 length:243 start_codon:yes stop_codon:yes gene_type:complete